MEALARANATLGPHDLPVAREAFVGSLILKMVAEVAREAGCPLLRRADAAGSDTRTSVKGGARRYAGGAEADVAAMMEALRVGGRGGGGDPDGRIGVGWGWWGWWGRAGGDPWGEEGGGPPPSAQPASPARAPHRAPPPPLPPHTAAENLIPVNATTAPAPAPVVAVAAAPAPTSPASSLPPRVMVSKPPPPGSGRRPVPREVESNTFFSSEDSDSDSDSDRAELAFDRLNLMSGVTSVVSFAFAQAPGLTEAQRVRRSEYAQTRPGDDQTTEKVGGKLVGQDAAGHKR